MIDIKQLLILALIWIDIPIIVLSILSHRVRIKIKHTAVIAVLLTLCLVVISMITMNSKYQEVSTEYYDLVETNGTYVYSEKSGAMYVNYIKDNKLKNLRVYDNNEVEIIQGTGLSEIQEITTRYKWFMFYADNSVYTVSLP